MTVIIFKLTVKRVENVVLGEMFLFTERFLYMHAKMYGMLLFSGLPYWADIPILLLFLIPI